MIDTLIEFYKKIYFNITYFFDGWAVKLVITLNTLIYEMRSYCLIIYDEICWLLLIVEWGMLIAVVLRWGCRDKAYLDAWSGCWRWAVGSTLRFGVDDRMGDVSCGVRLVMGVLGGGCPRWSDANGPP